MKKRILFFSMCLSSLLLVGCSFSTEKNVTGDQEKEIKTLKHQKKELELLLQNEKEKNTALSTTHSDPTESADTASLENLFSDFLKAEFHQDEKKLKNLTTATLYTILVTTAGGNGSNDLFKSTVQNIEIFQVEQKNNESALLIGRITVKTQVGENAPNQYQQLVECTAVKNSDGHFQISTQNLTTLAP